MAISQRLYFALVPLAAAAIAAGCAGGGSSIASGSSGSIIPPGAALPQFGGKATLNFLVPGRKPGSGARHPKYLGAGTSRIDVTVVPAGFPSPWPNPVSTTLPTPGPVPSGATPTPIPVSMSVAAPIGQAQFQVQTYDSSGYLISGVTSTPVPISNVAASNAISLTLNPFAPCVAINHVQGGAARVFPLENQTASQSFTFVVTPCDVDGNPIPAGQTLSNSIAMTETNPSPQMALALGKRPAGIGPGFFSPSPSTITQGGDTTVTIAYPGGNNLAHTLYAVASGAPSPLPSKAYGSITTDPIYYVVTADDGGGGKPVVAGMARDVLGALGYNAFPALAAGNGPHSIVAGSPQNGCTGAGAAAFVNDTDRTVTRLVLPTPPATVDSGPYTTPSPNPTFSPAPGPTPAFSPSILTSSVLSQLTSPVSAMTMDATCDVVFGNANGAYFLGLAPLSTFSYQSTLSVASPSPAPVNITSLAFAGTDLYVGSAGQMLTIQHAISSPSTVTPSAAPAVVDAAVPFSATQIAVAYRTGGSVQFGLWDGSTLTNTMALPSPAPSPTPAPVILSMATDGTTVYGISSSAFYYYSPGTSTWQQMTPYPAVSGTLRSIVRAPNKTGLYYVTTATDVQAWQPSGIAIYFDGSITGLTNAQGVAVFP